MTQLKPGWQTSEAQLIGGMSLVDILSTLATHFGLHLASDTILVVANALVAVYAFLRTWLKQTYPNAPELPPLPTSDAPAAPSYAAPTLPTALATLTTVAPGITVPMTAAADDASAT